MPDAAVQQVQRWRSRKAAQNRLLAVGAESGENRQSAPFLPEGRWVPRKELIGEWQEQLDFILGKRQEENRRLQLQQAGGGFSLSTKSAEDETVRRKTEKTTLQEND